MFTDQEKKDFSKDDMFGPFEKQSVTISRYESTSSNWVGVQYNNTNGERVGVSSIGWACKARALKQHTDGTWIPMDATINLGRTEKGKAINGGTGSPAIRMYNGKAVVEAYKTKTDAELAQLVQLGVAVTA